MSAASLYDDGQFLDTQWTAPAVHALAYFVAFWLVAEILLAILRLKSTRVDGLSTNSARKLVLNCLHLIISTLALVVIIVRALPILLLRQRGWATTRDGLVQLDGSNSDAFGFTLAFGITPYVTFIAFKLAYRTETPKHLTVQLISTLLSSGFALWSMRHTMALDDRGLTLQAAALLVFLFSEGLTGTCLCTFTWFFVAYPLCSLLECLTRRGVLADQLAHMALIVHRLHPLVSRRQVFRWPTFQMIIFQLLLSSWLLVIWVYLVFRDPPSLIGSRASFFRWTWRLGLPLLLLVTRGAKLYGWRLVFRKRASFSFRRRTLSHMQGRSTLPHVGSSGAVRSNFDEVSVDAADRDDQVITRTSTHESLARSPSGGPDIYGPPDVAVQMTQSMDARSRKVFPKLQRLTTYRGMALAEAVVAQSAKSQLKLGQSPHSAVGARPWATQRHAPLGYYDHEPSSSSAVAPAVGVAPRESDSDDDTGGALGIRSPSELSSHSDFVRRYHQRDDRHVAEYGHDPNVAQQRAQTPPELRAGIRDSPSDLDDQGGGDEDAALEDLRRSPLPVGSIPAADAQRPTRALTQRHQRFRSDDSQRELIASVGSPYIGTAHRVIQAGSMSVSRSHSEHSSTTASEHSATTPVRIRPSTYVSATLSPLGALPEEVEPEQQTQREQSNLERSERQEGGSVPDAKLSDYRSWLSPTLLDRSLQPPSQVRGPQQRSADASSQADVIADHRTHVQPVSMSIQRVDSRDVPSGSSGTGTSDDTTSRRASVALSATDSAAPLLPRDDSRATTFTVSSQPFSATAPSSDAQQCHPTELMAPVPVNRIASGLSDVASDPFAAEFETVNSPRTSASPPGPDHEAAQHDAEASQEQYERSGERLAEASFAPSSATSHNDASMDTVVVSSALPIGREGNASVSKDPANVEAVNIVSEAAFDRNA